MCLDGSGAHPQFTSDLPPGQTFPIAKSDDLITVKDGFGLTQGLSGFGPISPGVFHSCQNALTDDIPFEFRHRTDDREHGLAKGVLLSSASW